MRNASSSSQQGDAYAQTLVLLTFSRNGISFLVKEGKPCRPRHFAAFCQSRGKSGKGIKELPSALFGPQSGLRTNGEQEDGSAADEPLRSPPSHAPAETFPPAFCAPFQKTGQPLVIADQR